MLSDQLTLEHPGLAGADHVLLVEERDTLEGLPFHHARRQLLLSALRHHSDALVEAGHRVDHRRSATLADGIDAHIRRHRPSRLVVAHPHTEGGISLLESAAERHGVELAVLATPNFLTDAAECRADAARSADAGQAPRRSVMEPFYRAMRRRHGLLMDGDEPRGGRWNLDTENRRPAPPGYRAAAPPRIHEDAVDAKVRRDLTTMRLPASGRDGPRIFPATRAEAVRFLEAFVDDRLADFGRVQDAMINGEPFLAHAVLSSSLNLGLLRPLEVAQAAAARADEVPLPSVEGFVRQIVGWREYVFSRYWAMAGTARSLNALEADAPVPRAFWDGGTRMRCVASVVDGVLERGYAHHIERLMVLGNLGLIAGVEPWELMRWFWAMFVDGYEWVMLPNVLGMATYADGGAMMTKPYAGGGAYINRMSNHCRGCAYRPDRRTGADACPYSTLYWDFLDRHRQRLEKNHRMALPYRTLDRLDPDEVDAIRARAAEVRVGLSEGTI